MTIAAELTVLSTLWMGAWADNERTYTAEYVHRLRDMVRRNVSGEIDFACVTNVPERFFRKDVRVIPLQRDDLPFWWAKIAGFDPAIETAPRVLHIDLDVVIVRNIDAIIRFPSDFAIANYWSFSHYASAAIAVKRAARNRQRVLVPLYSSCVIIRDRNARSEIYTDFDAEKVINRDRLHGDQDWIATRFPTEKKFPRPWFRKMTPRRDRRFDIRKEPKLKLIACHPIKNADLHKHGFNILSDIWKGINE